MGRVQEVIVRGAAILASATAALALAACGSSDDAGASAAPPGFQQIDNADFSAAVPDGWQVAKRKVEGSSDEFTEVRPQGADINRVQLRVASSRKYGGDINAASLLHSRDISVRRPGAQETMNKATDVPGAADARRIEFTVPADAPLEATRIVTVLALSENRTLVNLSVAVAEGDPAASQIDEITRSLRLSS